MANAVLMASGLGSRMRPLTNTKPKPLIEVVGTPMIETVIKALQKAAVENIFIVVGYLGNQFGYLADKYSNVSIIRNTDYETINNISSIYYAREAMRLSDTFVCEADLYISDVDIIDKSFERFSVAKSSSENPAVGPDGEKFSQSGYFGKMIKGLSDDWVFEQNSDGVITRVGKVGTDCYNMVGLSYFTKECSVKIADAIEDIYGMTGEYEDLFWDDVVNSILPELNLMVFPVDDNQIVEIDTVAELEEVSAKILKEGK